MRLTLTFPFVVDAEIVGQGRAKYPVRASDHTEARGLVSSQLIDKKLGHKGHCVIIHGVSSPQSILMS